MKILTTLIEDNPIDETLDSVVESSNYFMQWWQNINWSNIISQFMTKVIYLLFTIFVFLLIKKIVKFLLKRTFETKRNKMDISSSRRNTVYKMVDNTVSYVLAFFLVYTILSILGIPISTLLASAGIAGLAIGLGAQSFINDIVNGFFILLENQFDVGDSVIIGEYSGKVVSIGLRSTQIQGFDGTHHFLPNHTIDVISNNSRNDMRALIEVKLPADTDFEKVRNILETVNDRLVPNFSEIVSGPSYIGPNNSVNGLMVMKVTFYTLNGQQFNVHDHFLAKYLEELSKAGISLPTQTFIS
ncbi:mechanosensitive ion channel family protein [Jeotgalibaca sp. A127]|uniref:mechanosensitive ion channel family protein n=1 Tax=Jeotgalibaca sp. A127 TaxID=3457324 RepID=UPI003FD139BD